MRTDVESCHRCRRAVGKEDAIPLWDGNTFCANCVEEAGSELAAYVRKHATLRDDAGDSVRRVAIKTFLTLWPFPTVLFGSIGVFEAWRQQNVELAMWGIVGFQVLILPIVGLWVAIIAKSYGSTNWSAEVSEGCVWLPRAGRHILLSECQWFLGTTTDATRPPFVPRRNAVLLAARPRGVLDEEIMAVSIEPEMLPVWTQFLTLAGIPRRIIWERRTRTPRVCFVIAGLLAIACGLVGTGWLGIILARLLNDLNLPKSIVDAVAFAFIVPGCMLMAFAIALLWPWSALPRVRSRRSFEEQRQVRRHYLIGGTLTSMTSLVYLTVGGVGWLVHFAISLAFGTMFGLVVGHFRATREWATTEESLAACD